MDTPAAPSQGRGRPLRLAVTLGDPRGIGPEVAAEAARRWSLESAGPDEDPAGRPELLFVGPAGTGAESAADAFHPVGEWRPGESPAVAGRLAGLAIEAATGFALDGEVDGLVTAPIDKAALLAGGFDFPGHTEMLATLAGRPAGPVPVAMLMAAEETTFGGPLRVALATTHIPLAEVPAALTVERLVTQSRLVAEGLRRGWGLDRPRIALGSVNPHASDGGRFGDEEARIVAPARDALRAAGIAAEGPVPADTVYLRALRGEFDAVVAPYHDVGMAAFKTAAFGKGVNVTVGLPFIRTSPDHGTALDIAGRGLADPASMIEALELAARLARNGVPAPTSGV